MQQCISPLICPALLAPHLYTLFKEIRLQSFNFHSNITFNAIVLVTSDKSTQISSVTQLKFAV